MPPAPIDINEWWLAAAAATSILAPVATAQAATQPGTQVGITTAVRPGVTTTTNDRVVYIGNAVTFGERFKTDSTGVIHILFMDQSSMTLGPNSELVIDEFTFNPESRRGSIAVNLVKGALRVVGGFISKFNTPQGFSAARVQTTTATIGIRGGISTVESNGQNTTGTFLFGQQMSISNLAGNTQTVTRPGFSSSVSGVSPPTPPSRVPFDQMNRLTQQFGNPSSGGNRPPNTTPPGGQLISTGGNPIGNNPNTGLAPDRTGQSSNQMQTQTPQNTLRNLLGSTPNQS